MTIMGGQLIQGASRMREAKASVTFDASNTTASEVVFTVTGIVYVFGMWGEVTTVLGSAHTAAHWRLNDQTATVDLTLASGVTLSSYPVGGLIYREGLAASALTIKTPAAGFMDEAASANAGLFSPFIVGKKTAAVTTIDHRYSTTNTPTSGVIRFHALWFPISDDGNLA